MNPVLILVLMVGTIVAIVTILVVDALVTQWQAEKEHERDMEEKQKDIQETLFEEEDL